MNEVLLGLLVAIPAVATVVVAVSRALRGLREERREWRDAVIVALDRNSVAIEAQVRTVEELIGVIQPRAVEKEEE